MGKGSRPVIKKKKGCGVEKKTQGGGGGWGRRRVFHSAVVLEMGQSRGGGAVMAEGRDSPSLKR